MAKRKKAKKLLIRNNNVFILLSWQIHIVNLQEAKICINKVFFGRKQLFTQAII